MQEANANINAKDSTSTFGNGADPSTQRKYPVAKAVLGVAAVVAFYAVFAGSVAAQCFSPEGRTADALPELKSILQQKLAEQPPQQPTRNRGAAPIVGLWYVSVRSGGQVVDVGFDAWQSDGTEILNDYTNPIQGNVCLGVWERTNRKTFRLKHPSWTFDSNGNLTGTAIIRETVTVDSEERSFSGPGTVDVYDLKGKHIAHYDEQVEGTRITVD